MEMNCTRCHQAIEADNCFCPACGLPQLVYSAESIPGQAPAERFSEPVRDAGTVDWKRAMPMALMLAVPAGMLSSGASPIGFLGLFWMSAAAAWAVALYLRSQRPAWITVGAGARIGLVTGLVGAWLAFGVSGSALLVERAVFHQSGRIDAEWKTRVEQSQQVTQQWMSSASSADASQMQAARAQIQTFMMSPQGHAGIEAFGFASTSAFLILFAVAGGALGARLLARVRRPQP